MKIKKLIKKWEIQANKNKKIADENEQKNLYVRERYLANANTLQICINELKQCVEKNTVKLTNLTHPLKNPMHPFKNLYTKPFTTYTYGIKNYKKRHLLWRNILIDIIKLAVKKHRLPQFLVTPYVFYDNTHNYWTIYCRVR